MSEQRLPHTPWRFIWHFVCKQPIKIGSLAFFHLAWTIDNFRGPYIVTLFTGFLGQSTPGQADFWVSLVPPFTLFFVLLLVPAVMFRLADTMGIRVYPTFESQIRMATVGYIQGHSYQYVVDQMAGSMANKVSDIVGACSRTLAMSVILYLPTCVTFSLAFGYFAWIYPFFGAVVGVWFVGHLGIMFVNATRINRLSEVHSESQSDLSGKIVDSFTNVLPIKLFASSNIERRIIQKQQDDERGKHAVMLRFLRNLRICQEVWSIVMMVLLFPFLLFYKWNLGDISTSQFIFIYLTSWNVIVLTWYSGFEIPNLFKDLGILTQGLRLIEHRHDIVDAPGASTLNVSKGEVVFQGVHFAYTPHNPVFEDLNVIIPSGQKVGLVGFSGSGKTTFVNVILRFYEPQRGQVLIDGQDSLAVTQASLRQHISMIPQDPTLFHRTIFDNIHFGNPKATREEVIEASKLAQCHEFVTQLEGGYDALVGERGVKLSGGQRQRVSIARAFLKNAPILILDEATSALDSVTESVIQESFLRLMKGKTTLVVAHRLSTLKEMDRLLVFDQGRIIEDGSHEELLAKKGHYARMWGMQVGGFLPDSGG